VEDSLGVCGFVVVASEVDVDVLVVEVDVVLGVDVEYKETNISCMDSAKLVTSAGSSVT
jgi:hypothetical protein